MQNPQTCLFSFFPPTFIYSVGNLTESNALFSCLHSHSHTWKLAGTTAVWSARLKGTSVVVMPFCMGCVIGRIWCRDHPCLVCVASGVHAVRIPEDERYLLGPDGDGPDGSAAPDESTGDHRLHQSLSARVWRHQCKHRTRPPSALHSKRRPGESSGLRLDRLNLVF